MAVVGAAAACSSTETSDTPSESSAGTNGPVKIYLTRHGKTMLNTLDRVQGWSDSPLIADGQKVADDLGAGFAAEKISFEAAYCADMVRHYTTATHILAGVDKDLEPSRDERLREVSFGSFEGAMNDEMWDVAAKKLGYADKDALLGHADQWKMDDALDAIAASVDNPDTPAEDAQTVRTRATEALEEIASKQEKAGGGNVLVVSSGLTIFVTLEGLGADLTGVSGIENAAVSLLGYEDGTWTVESVNDLSYVEKGEGK